MNALIDSNSIIVSEGGETVLVAADDPAYSKVRNYLESQGSDFNAIRDIVNGVRVHAKAVLGQALAAVDGDGLESTYRIEHGDPVEEVILTTALRLNAEQADFAPLGRFLKRLERNPSQASRSQLFGWLKAGGFTITTEGMIVGYKSVRRDGLSSHSGREPVTVAHQDGRVETLTGHIPYPVGATVWMPRHLVDDNRQSACSRGLHVGTWSYATSFSEQLLVVLVDPADVVSVPADYSAQKMRVCRLRVAAIHDGEQITDAVIQAIRTIPDFEAGEEYAARPENKVEQPSFSLSDFPHITVWDYDEYEDGDYEDAYEDADFIDLDDVGELDEAQEGDDTTTAFDSIPSLPNWLFNRLFNRPDTPASADASDDDGYDLGQVRF